MIQQGLVELKEMIITESNIAEGMIRKALEGLLKKDSSLLGSIVGSDEKEINELEIKIDEECAKILALYQPEAKDLRTVLMLSRMNVDLEKIGDHCVNIAESAKYLIDKPDVKPLIDLPRMAEETIRMLRDSINSIFNENEELAITVCKRDEIIDELHEQIFRELITYMISDPKTIERSLHLIRISSNFEKIADLTTNICEETVYIASGHNIKHRHI